MALRQATAEQGGSRGATVGAGRAGCDPIVEVPRSVLFTIKAGFFSLAQARLETALLADHEFGLLRREMSWNRGLSHESQQSAVASPPAACPPTACPSGSACTISADRSVEPLSIRTASAGVPAYKLA